MSIKLSSIELRRFWMMIAHYHGNIFNASEIGFEFKYTDQPKITKSMTIALEDLALDKLIVIFPGNSAFPLARKIEAVGLEAYLMR